MICVFPAHGSIDNAHLSQSGVIEQGASFLRLQNTAQYRDNEQILIRAARDSEENDHIPEAIKLYNLAGDYGMVISCLAQALGNTYYPSLQARLRRARLLGARQLRFCGITNG